MIDLFAFNLGYTWLRGNQIAPLRVILLANRASLALFGSSECLTKPICNVTQGFTFSVTDSTGDRKKLRRALSLGASLVSVLLNLRFKTKSDLDRERLCRGKSCCYWSSATALFLISLSHDHTICSACHDRTGRRRGSIGRASDSEDPRFEPRQEHKTNLKDFFLVKNQLLC